MTAATPFNQRTIDEFHAKGGRGIGGWGHLLLLMTAKGARSGREITTPLVYRRSGKDHVVVASKAGAAEDPQWFRNVEANPVVSVEVAGSSGIDGFRARARLVREGSERDRLYAYMAEIWPAFTAYAEKAGRTIPVVILERLPDAEGL